MDFQVANNLMSNKMDVSSFIDMSYLKKAQAQIDAGNHPKLSDIRITAK